VIPLQKKSIKYDISGHANHPQYDKVMQEKINDILNTAQNENDAFNKIQNLINNTKNKLEDEVLLGTKNINNLIDF
jgi:hypothetical protein